MKRRLALAWPHLRGLFRALFCKLPLRGPYDKVRIKDLPADVARRRGDELARFARERGLDPDLFVRTADRIHDVMTEATEIA